MVSVYGNDMSMDGGILDVHVLKCLSSDLSLLYCCSEKETIYNFVFWCLFCILTFTSLEVGDVVAVIYSFHY